MGDLVGQALDFGHLGLEGAKGLPAVRTGCDRGGDDEIIGEYGLTLEAEGEIGQLGVGLADVGGVGGTGGAERVAEAAVHASGGAG